MLKLFLKGIDQPINQSESLHIIILRVVKYHFLISFSPLGRARLLGTALPELYSLGTVCLLRSRTFSRT